MKCQDTYLDQRECKHVLQKMVMELNILIQEDKKSKKSNWSTDILGDDRGN